MTKTNYKFFLSVFVSFLMLLAFSWAPDSSNLGLSGLQAQPVAKKKPGQVSKKGPGKISKKGPGKISKKKPAAKKATAKKAAAKKKAAKKAKKGD